MSKKIIYKPFNELKEVEVQGKTYFVKKTAKHPLKFVKTCENCKIEYLAARNFSKFCSNSCRQEKSNRKKRETIKLLNDTIDGWKENFNILRQQIKDERNDRKK